MRRLKYILFLLLLLIAKTIYLNAQSHWTQKADFPSWRSGVTSFSIGSKGYFACGVDNSFTAYNDLWEYDPVTDVWTQKAGFNGTTRYSASGFSIGNFGYVCLGWDIGGNGLDDLWEYDPVSNTWNAKANFPGTARYNAVAFVIGNKAYVGLGYKPVQSDFYEYDPSANTWTVLANAFPGGARTTAAAFTCTYTIAGTTYEKGFVGTGSLDPDVNSVLGNDLWEFTPGFTPGSGTWLAKSNLPDSGRYSCFAFSLNNRGYIGGGIGVGLVTFNNFYEYDPITDTWAVKDSFPGINSIHARGFAINNIGYAGTGQDLATYYPYFYKYSPDVIPSVQVASSDTSFCDKHCIDFFDLSTNNPTSWQWFFPGADSTTSTLQNPTGICYNNYGSFDVTLIACNSAGCDTLLLPGFINEYALSVATITQSNDTLFASAGNSYQWFSVDSGLIAGATNSYFIPTHGGDYFVIVTDSIGCGGTSNVITVAYAGLNQVAAGNEQIAIMPNPNYGSFVVSVNAVTQKDFSLQITNSSGQTVSHRQWSSRMHKGVTGHYSINVDLGNVAPGLYAIEIINENKIYHNTFIVE